MTVKVLGTINVSATKISFPSSDCIPASFILFSRSPFLNAVVNFFTTFTVVVYIMLLRPRVVILSTPDSYPIIWAYVASKIVGAKLIIDVRDPFEELIITRARSVTGRFLAKFIANVYYSIYRRSDAVLAVTKVLVDILQKRAISAFLVPNGADLDKFRPLCKAYARTILGLNKDEFIIACIGLLGGYYCITWLLYAIKSLVNKKKIKVRVLLAGEIVDRETKLTLKSPSFRDMAMYLGVLDAQGITTILSAADVGVIPRLSDPIYDYSIPVKFYEYVALGLPVLAICRRGSLLAKVVEVNSLGVVCDPGEIVCLEKALEKLLDEKVYFEIKHDVLKFRKNVDRRVGASKLLAIVRYFLEEKRHEE